MPMPTPDPDYSAYDLRFDFIILGGGCAGLSLASHLALQPNPPRVLIVETRTHYTEDRTWCGWRVGPHLFDDCAVAQWNDWHIADSQDATHRHDSSEILRSSSRYPYQMVRSIDVYEKAQRLIAQAPSITLMLNTAATALVETPSQAHATLSNGRTVSAPWVIDTRPSAHIPAQTLAYPWMWQNFVGYVLQLAPQQRTQWGERPTLMDFQPARHDVLQFLYLIPISDGRYLCEWTRFATTHGQQDEIEGDLNGWLSTHLEAGTWSIERRESGSLPMSLPAERSSPTDSRIVNAGTRGGSMRASTGYAFHAIQRWAAACAASFATSGTPLAPTRSWLLDRMDELFLRVLQQPSTNAADLFYTLFAEVPTDPLIRFLSGIPKATDLWPVVRPLPWLRFLRALLATVTQSSPYRSQPQRTPPLPKHSGSSNDALR